LILDIRIKIVKVILILDLNYHKLSLCQIIQFFYIDDVAIPHSWYTVNYFNKNLYFRVFEGQVHLDYILILSEQLYNGTTLATEIQAKITENGYTPTVTYNASKQTISISISSFNFKF
jgi:hypothetical protein